MIYHIAETTSTNDLAREERYGHGDVICAERQTAGRGQRGHTWTSPEGVNLLFSVVLCPTFLPAGEQFLLSQAVALALVDTLGTCGIDARIKWTNDIYAGDRKLVGILIEHHLAGGRLARTVAGIGINVNQTEFDPALPNPTSMALEAGRTFDREEVLDRFHAALMRRYAALEAGDRAPLAEEYRRRMYRIDAPQAFRLPDGTPFHGRDPRCPRRGRVAGRTPRRHVARLSFQGDRVRGEKIAGGVGNEKIRRIFVSPALQAAGIRDADHPAGQKAGTARPAQPAERPSGSHRCDGNG